MELLPLKSLVFSKSSNVRKTDIDKGLEELIASIRVHGLLQNLTVVAINDKFEVIAGQRRLRAIKFLAKNSEWPADRLIPCEAVNKEQAEEISLAENVVREPMHPADQYEAYVKLVDNGMTVGEIASHFGVAESHVSKLLKLGRVSPKLLKLYRKEEMSLEVLMAFAVSDDIAKQEEVYQRFKDSWQIGQPRYIREALTETMLPSNHKFVQFVGIETYEKAGGTLRRDLFSEHDSSYLENADLVMQLMNEKLVSHAEELQQIWRWVEIQPELDYSEKNKYDRIYAHSLGEVPEALTDQQTQLAEQLAQSNNDEEVACLEKELKAVTEKIASYHGFTTEEYAIAGCIITISYRGELELHKGLIHPEDKKALKKTADTNGSTVSAPTSQYSQALTEKLKNYRLQVIRQHLAQDYKTAFDAALYQMCVHHFKNGYYGKNWLTVRAEKYYLPAGLTTEDDTSAALYQQEEKLHESLPLEWLNLSNETERFQAFCGLDIAQKHALFAACIAQTLQPQLSNETNGARLFEVIATRLGISIEKHWRPTASSFLNHITKQQLIDLGRGIFGEEWAKSYAKPPKTEVVNFLHDAFSNPHQSKFTEEQQAKLLAWLPEGLECRLNYKT